MQQQSRYEIVSQGRDLFSVFYRDRDDLPAISSHRTEADAKSAVKRYEAGDKRRGQ